MGDTNFLNTGGVLPSNLEVDEGEGYDESRDANNYAKKNFSLKVGQIEESYCTDQEGNVRGSRIEYDVLVNESNGDGSTSQMTYRRVLSQDLFGGIADFFQFTHRKNEKDQGRDAPFRNGSLVLILCLNGSNEDAIIVGGLKHPNNSNECTEEEGHNLKFEFNGINFEIDKEGAMTLLFRGPTDADGKVLEGSKEFGGTKIKIEKDGSYEVNTGEEENPTQLRLDKTEKTITLMSEKGQSFLTMGTYTVDATKDISIKTGAALAIEATGSATIKAKSLELTLEAAAEITCKQMKIKANSLVDIKTNLFKTNNLTQLGGGAIPLALSTLVTVGTGFAGVPVISSMISGFATKVLGK